MTKHYFNDDIITIEALLEQQVESKHQLILKLAKSLNINCAFSETDNAYICQNTKQHLEKLIL